MYSSTQVASTSAGVEMVYVARLRDNFDELEVMKQNALNSEDYTSANLLKGFGGSLTKDKMLVLQSQLDRMDDQFTAGYRAYLLTDLDILQNCVTNWIGGIVTLLQTFTTLKTTDINPLELPFHTSFLNIIKGIPLSYYDALIRAMLILFPHDLPDGTKSPFGWDFLAKKIQIPVKSQDMVDVMKSTVSLLLMDVVIISIGGSSSVHIKKETYDLTLRHIFHHIHTVAIRKVNNEWEGPIFDKTFTRCSLTVGYIAQLSNTKDIFRYAVGFFDSSKKIPPEEIALALSLLRYSFSQVFNLLIQPKSQSQVLEALLYIRELMQLFDKSKKQIIKNAIIQTLERVIQPIVCLAEKTVDDGNVWAEIALVYKKARKWVAVEDLRISALNLMTVILVNSRIDFFASNIDSFINTDLCSKNKVRPYAYHCLLQLLRGRYYQDTIQHYEQELNGEYVCGRHFSSLIRAVNEQSFGTVSNRLNSISEMMFFRRKAVIPEEHRETSASIVAQIAAHSISLGAKLIIQLLDTNRVDSSPDCYYVGLRALRIILDRESGFQKFAYSQTDPDFKLVVRDFPYDLTPSISAIYAYMETQVGVSVIGTSGKLIDLPSEQPKDQHTSHRTKQTEMSTASVMLDLLAQTYGMSSSTEKLNSSDDVNGSQGALNTSLRRSRTDMSPSSPSILQRGSLIGSMNTLAVAPSLNDLELDCELVEEHIERTLTEWFTAVGSSTKDIRKFFCSSSLIDKIRIKKRANEKLKFEQREALNLLHEIILIVQFVPTPEFIGGNYFIGAFLSHSDETIVREVANALISIFKDFPDLRLGIVNGFINFMKNTPNRDDISTCTNLMVLARLVKIWTAELDQVSGFKVQIEAFYRVSCKMDATMLLLMSYPNNKIRSISLQIIFDFYTIQQSIGVHGTKPGEMPLAAILLNSETVIVKQAIFAFLQADGSGHQLSSKVASSLNPLTFLEIAASNCAGLFRYYQGELAKRFSFYGRHKATRHLAKYLMALVVPLIESSAPSAGPDQKYLFSSYMVLLMAMAGVPVTSESQHIQRIKTTEDINTLLFGSFRSSIPRMLTMEEGWETNAILSSFYFLHRDVIQLHAAELMMSFQEVRHNSSVVLNSRFLDNLFSMIRHIVQYPHFELLIQDDPDGFAGTLIQTYSDFMTFSSLAVFSDTLFLSEGNSARIKSSIDFCIIVHRLCESLNSTGRKLLRQARFDGDMEPLRLFERAKWQVNQRRTIVSQMKDWYDAIQEGKTTKEGGLAYARLVTSGLLSNSYPDDARKLVILKDRLLSNISSAMEQIMSLGDIFIQPPLPAGLLLWLATMESDGYRVFTPEFMYTFEDALGTALASSYSGKGTKSPWIFTKSIFEQILPKLDDGPHMYLFGTSRRMSFAEPFIASIHGLPPKNPTDLDSPSFLYPDISAEDAIRLKQHLGSLLFYGLYNLMSANISVRVQSLVFLRELLQMYNPDENNFDVQSHLKSFNGPFYSGARIFIKEKIIGLSLTCAELFAGDSGSLLWEAVRCARSITPQGTSCLLLNPRTWIMELILPWCQYVNLGAINVDMVNAEFFRYLMDYAFDQPDQSDDIVNCWGEVARSPEFGTVNAAVLMDVVVEVSARFTVFESSTLLLASNLSLIQPDLVSTVLAFHLSSAAFPWNHTKVSHSFQHSSQLAIKDYITTLHSTFKVSAPESENSYRLNCASAARLVSQILPQRYEHFITHMPVLLNYILVHLGGSLKKSSASGILQGCIYGYISHLHATEGVQNPALDEVQSLIRKFLGWTAMADAQVTWNLEKELPTLGFQVTEIPIDQFAELLVSVFGFDDIGLRGRMIEELVKWASEGFLGHDETVHAMKSYYVLLIPKSFPSKFYNPLLPRLLDQLAVLSQLELEMKLLKPAEKGVSSWSQLPRGKRDLLADSQEIILIILKIHSLLLMRFVEAGILETHEKLFWASVGLLNLSSVDFPEIISSCLDNLLYMFDNLEQDRLDMYFLAPFGDLKSCNIQTLLIPILFGENKLFKEKALLILLNSWLFFPPLTVDNNKPALFYTVMYSLTLIFLRFLTRDIKTPLFYSSITKLTEVLALYYPNQMTDLKIGLDTLQELFIKVDVIDPETANILLQQCVGCAIEFFQEYGNNVAQYVSHIVSISAAYREVGIRIAQLLWHSSDNKLHANGLSGLRNLLRTIPFMKESDLMTEELILEPFNPPNHDLIKELDVASQGKVEYMPDVELSGGSVKAALNWLSSDLGIAPSNRMFGLM